MGRKTVGQMKAEREAAAAAGNSTAGNQPELEMGSSTSSQAVPENSSKPRRSLPKAFADGGEESDPVKNDYDYGDLDDSGKNKLRTKEEREAKKKVLKNQSQKEEEFASEDDGISKNSDDEKEPEEDLNDEQEEEIENEFDEDLLERISDLGLSEEDFEGVPASAVKKFIRKMERQERESIRSQQHDEKKVPSDADEDKDTGNILKDEDFELDLDPEEFEPEVVDAFKKLNAKYKKLFEKVTGSFKEKVDVLQNKLGIYEQEKENEKKIAIFNNFDSLIKGLTSDEKNGEFFKTNLGEGSFDTVKKGSKAFMNRSKLYKEMTIQQIASEQAGENISMKEAFNKAVKLLYSDHAKEQVKREIKTKLEKNKKTITMRPNQRKNLSEEDIPSGREKAKKFVRDFFEKKKSGQK